MIYLNFLLILLLAPVIAYLLYMGIKVLRISAPEYRDLVQLQGEGFRSGYMGNMVVSGSGDYRIRRGLEVSEDGKVILEQGAISTNALKTAYPH